MPNVVVYVPVKAWKMFEERGLDPAEVIREFAKRGYEMNGPELAEGSEIEVKRTVPAPRSTGTAQTHGTATELPGVASPSASSDAHFKPDFK